MSITCNLHDIVAEASSASGTTVTSTYSTPADLQRWFKNVGADIVTLRGYIGMLRQYCTCMLCNESYILSSTDLTLSDLIYLAVTHDIMTTLMLY